MGRSSGSKCPQSLGTTSSNVAPFAKFQPVLDMQFAGIKTSLVEFDLILGIPGIGF